MSPLPLLAVASPTARMSSTKENAGMARNAGIRTMLECLSATQDRIAIPIFNEGILRAKTMIRARYLYMFVLNLCHIYVHASIFVFTLGDVCVCVCVCAGVYLYPRRGEGLHICVEKCVCVYRYTISMQADAFDALRGFTSQGKQMHSMR